MQLAFNLLGILAVFGICWLLSWQRKSINWKLIGKAFVIQLLLAVFIVKVPLGQQVISILSDGVTAVVNCGKDGVSFVFGDLADTSKMFVFAVASLGNIIFVSALVEFLYYIGALGFIVTHLGRLVKKLVGSTEVESFVATANIGSIYQHLGFQNSYDVCHFSGRLCQCQQYGYLRRWYWCIVS